MIDIGKSIENRGKQYYLNLIKKRKPYVIKYHKEDNSNCWVNALKHMYNYHVYPKPIYDLLTYDFSDFMVNDIDCWIVDIRCGMPTRTVSIEFIKWEKTNNPDEVGLYIPDEYRYDGDEKYLNDEENKNV